VTLEVVDEPRDEEAERSWLDEQALEKLTPKSTTKCKMHNAKCTTQDDRRSCILHLAFCI
jgi:hypothetical protein